ncbi:hypothetical protein FB567DRAFT_220429 [Paraphoma chrysanthemicola]|uniref:Uncharacterized protein n=1 Tax=Paraphoma chrysanthemicola TaxID=798071 RepID=A0A8K0QTD3_9PLEO|nr:hypothetical protein FB567DRAFT_220429 [Paraphoma chrysanthemicola]
MARFIDLPPECRNSLYHELLGSEIKPQRRIPHELAMLTVSKQIHDESSSYMYQNNNIVIDAPSDTTGSATILPPISDRYLRYLRTLTIQAFIGPGILEQTRKVATAIASLPSIGARFTVLTCLFTSPLSHLLTSRVDDTVMDQTHPITSALRGVLESNVAEIVRIQLDHVWFAPGVARHLKSDFGTRVEFSVNGNIVLDMDSLERSLTGRYSSTHLVALGLDAVDVEMTPTPNSTPSSLPSSLCSAFADLDTFSVTSFEWSSDEEESPFKDFDDDSTQDQADAAEQPFFTEDDIEEWSAATDRQKEEEELGIRDDTGEDEEMDDVQQEDILAIMRNMEENAHHVANKHDISYMANFAPELLLSRHHLGHLV